MTTERDSEVRTLYKFRPYSSQESRRRVEDILLGNRLFIPAPTTFNDPFDPRPRYVAASRDKMAYHVTKKARKDFGPDSQVERQILKADYKAAVEEITKKYQQIFRNDSGVLSLTGTREPILLWSHYAANHTGVCIHFDRRIEPFHWCVPVRYTDAYPTIEIPIDDDYFEHFLRILATKATTWAYEREYRLVRLPESMAGELKDMGQRWDGQHMLIAAEAITGITLGALMPSDERVQLTALCSARAPAIPIWQASLHDAQFALNFAQVTSPLPT